MSAVFIATVRFLDKPILLSPSHSVGGAALVDRRREQGRIGPITASRKVGVL